MSIYTPDGYTFVKIEDGKTDPIYKIMGSWSGGYLSSDAWRMNSGITKVTKGDDGLLQIHGNSGSIYEVLEDGRPLNNYAANVLNTAIERATGGIKITPVSTKDIMEVFYEETQS